MKKWKFLKKKNKALLVGAFSICPDMEDIKSTWNLREQASIKK